MQESTPSTHLNINNAGLSNAISSTSPAETVIPLLQGLMQGQGWHDQRGAIMARDQAEALIVGRSKQAAGNYDAAPTAANRAALIAALLDEIADLNTQRDDAQRLQQGYVAQAEQLTKTSVNHSQGWGEWMVSSLKSMVSGTPAQQAQEQAKDYGKIAAARQARIDQLQAVLLQLTHMQNQAKEESLAGDILAETEAVSPLARRLLENPSVPVTASQYCYPSGACELSDLSQNGSGLVLQGEMAGDYSGYPVSTAGDVNGDGVDDLLIGAYGADPSGRISAGKSYVVFGSRNGTVWGNGTLELSSIINGVRGFVLQGEAAGDASGFSVSTAGDVNGDGVDDLLVGAYGASPSNRTYAGKSYVVFGSRNSTLWGNGTLELSGIRDGVRGFVLQGEVASDRSGWSASTAGDVNGDGVDDLLIGAYDASPSGRSAAGKSYVMFGSRNSTAWGNGTLELGSIINGVRGFVLQGEASSDQSGSSVSTAGDVNGDGVSDLLIGAYQASPSGRSVAGKSYVVFGSRNNTVWGNGTLELSSIINGVRGFVLQGEATGDRSGCSVSTAGDVNGDGVDDLLIGAYGASSSGQTYAGKSYVVFGSRNSTVWGNGVLDLSNLINGISGFALQGEAVNDYSGYSVSTAGDVNGDGASDLLIGAFRASPGGRTYAGKSYVVFGSRNSTVWGNGVLDLSNLINGISGFALQGEAVNDFSGYSVSTAGDVNGDGASDLLIGVFPASPGGRTNAGKSYVVWGAINNQINFTANSLTVATGETVVVDNTNLALISSSLNTSALVIKAEAIVHGSFTIVTVPNFAISSFAMQSVAAGKVLFTHDSGPLAPGYRLVTRVGTLQYYSDANINFVGYRPELGNNQLLIDQGKAVTLQSSDLSATDRDDSLGSLVFIVSNIQQGQFNLYNATGQLQSANISQFTQQAIYEQRLEFVHDGSLLAPSYSVAVSDSRSTTSSRNAVISFNLAPVLTTNRIIIDQGQAIVLSPEDILASDVETFNEDIIIEVSNITHGSFVYGNNPSFPLTSFRQFSLLIGALQFIHDGSNANASFALRAFDGRIYSGWQIPTTHLNRRPVLQANVTDKTVKQGKFFRFDLDSELFADPDGEALNYTAQLEGGAPLPKGVEFIPPTRFQGELSTLTSLQIEVQAHDPRGLTATAGFGLDSQSPTASGINIQSLYTTVSSLGGALVAVAGYLWWRKKVSEHRRGYEFANDLRKAANLEYHDFMRLQGDIYKTVMEHFLMKVDSIQPGFYKDLTADQRKSFAVCINEFLEQYKLLKPSGYGMGLYGLVFAFSVGWSQQLDLNKFRNELTEIAQEAIKAWKAESDPVTRWPYFSPTMKDKVKACCGARPSQAGMFARQQVRLSRSEGSKGVELTDLKHQAIDVSPPRQEIEIVLSPAAMSSSSRFFDGSASTYEERMGLIEKEVRNLASTTQQGMQEIAGNVKNINTRVEQLEIETRPLLMGVGNSSS